MNERLVSFDFTLEAHAGGSGAAGVTLPPDVGFTVKGVSWFGAHSGTPTGVTIDLQDDTVDIVGAIAIDIAANGYDAIVPVQVAAGSVIEVDLNFTGGTSPAATGILSIFGFFDEK